MPRFAGLVLMALLACCTTGFAQEPATAYREHVVISVRNSDTCMAPGQRVRLAGTNLGKAQHYRLLLRLGRTSLELEAESWNDSGITAIMPAPLPSGEGVIFLADTRSGVAVSNRETVRLCPQEVEAESRAVRAEPDGGGQLTERAPVRNGDWRLTVPPEKTDAGISPWQSEYEPGEVIAYSDSLDEAQRLEATLKPLGFTIKRRRVLKNLGLVVSVWRFPAQMDVPQALALVRQSGARTVVEPNYRYRLTEGEPSPGVVPMKQIRWPAGIANCAPSVRIGMIDTAVDVAHPALDAATLEQKSFLPLGMRLAARKHGTAIASLLVGRTGSGISGLLPGGRLYAAAIFRQTGEGLADTTAELIAAAMDWLAEREVTVVNMSFAGPASKLIEEAIGTLERAAITVVAAAGNGGERAPAAYPAAYPRVVAVTAVDIDNRIYSRANRGSYIDFSAPGVDVWAARSGSGGAYFSGTSFAVPYVTAAVSLLKGNKGGPGPEALEDVMARRALDLGTPGRDPVFGHGLIQADGYCH